jgi:hypothetical protein
VRRRGAFCLARTAPQLSPKNALTHRTTAYDSQIPLARTAEPGLPPMHIHRPQSGTNLWGDRKWYQKWLAGNEFTMLGARAGVRIPYKVGHLKSTTNRQKRTW